MNDVKFEWDNNKAQANIEKHGITSHEASTIISDENAIRFDNPEHSIEDGDFVMEEMDMREEYNIKALNPRKNPYAKKIRKPVTTNMSVTTIEYFKAMSDESGIPYQILMNYYLDDCVKQQKKLQFVGEPESANI